MVNGVEPDEIVRRVRLDDEIMGGLEADGGPEVSEAERYGAAEIYVAGIAEEAHTSVRLVLDGSPSNFFFGLNDVSLPMASSAFIFGADAASSAVATASAAGVCTIAIAIGRRRSCTAALTLHAWGPPPLYRICFAGAAAHSISNLMQVFCKSSRALKYSV
ncbi:hypothetical protein ACLOJK_041933 [Asimina triloba]